MHPKDFGRAEKLSNFETKFSGGEKIMIPLAIAKV